MSRGDAGVYFLKLQAPGSSTAEPIDVSDRVLSLKYEDNESAADKLTLTVNNYDLENFDTKLWRKGALLEVAWGYAGDTCPPRQCVIQSVKGFTILNVVALAKSILLHKEQRSRRWDGLTRAEVVRRIAEEHGYTDASRFVDETHVALPSIAQVRETDAAFLTRLAKREGFQFYIDFDGFHWHERKLSQAPVREYIYFTDPARGDILDIEVENDITAAPAEIKAKGRDPLTKQDFSVTASNEDTARAGTAPQIEEAVDARSGVITVVRHVGPSSEHSEAAAKRAVDGAFKKAAMTAVQLKVKAIADPSQLAKTVIKLSGIRSLSGNYHVSQVVHEIKGTYTMEMKVKSDGRGAGGAPSDAKVNKEDVKDAGAGELTPEERVDPRSGETRTSFHDRRGRSSK